MSRKIFAQEVQRQSERAGLFDSIQNLSDTAPLMAGKFAYESFAPGLSMHYCDVVEQQDSQNQLQLPAGLSFNIMFAGRIDYTFADQRLCLAPIDEQVSCSAIINADAEMLSRNLHRGMHIKKVNVFVERQWLLAHCHGAEDEALLQGIFTSSRVLSWAADQQLINLATKLMASDKTQDLYGRLEREQQTLQLLSCCLATLEAQLDTSVAGADCQVVDSSLKAEVERQLCNCRNIAELAASLNMSERTLQRQFKARYGITVTAYFKKRRLDRAKKALVMDRCSIGEAAFAAGYNHSSNFVHAFKKEFGLTPAEFAACHRPP
ncbi:MAG: helix-turn-helix transcriptional regulator [Cellvibrionaceae bacterium]|nr:helix-turn-helix transcriptional regulator [Cellvibrionaceae bacterium]